MQSPPESQRTPEGQAVDCPSSPAASAAPGDSTPATRSVAVSRPIHRCRKGLASLTAGSCAHPIYATDHDESVGHMGGHTSFWLWVMCLTGVDYFSTLGYQPAIAFEAAGVLAPLATVVLVLVTLFGALPVYAHVASSSPRGQGSIAMLERLVHGWTGKTMVLALLGFAATDFVITMTLSAADASVHLIENPLWKSMPNWVQALSDDRQRLGVTIFMLVLLGACFLRGFKEVIGLAVGIVGVYLALNAFVLISGSVYLVAHPALLQEWYGKLTSGDWEIAEAPLSGHGWGTIAALSVLYFPKLALGLSGFETGVAVMPLIRGGDNDTPQNPAGRIFNTRKLLVTAALIMCVCLLSSSMLVATLIPAAELHEPAGKAADRALAYLAHGQSPFAINPLFGEVFGTIYDVSTVVILGFAGASAMAGLLNLVPQYLPRYGMAPEWARAVRPLVILFALINLLVTWIFDADVGAEGGAYATGVLVLMSSACTATVIDHWRDATGAWYRRLSWRYLAITCIFYYTTAANMIERPDGIKIASWFIIAIVLSSFWSRLQRSSELRFKAFEFADLHSKFLWDSLKHLEFPVLVPHRPGRRGLDVKEASIRERHRLGNDVPIVFVEASLGRSQRVPAQSLDGNPRGGRPIYPQRAAVRVGGTRDRDRGLGTFAGRRSTGNSFWLVGRKPAFRIDRLLPVRRGERPLARPRSDSQGTARRRAPTEGDLGLIGPAWPAQFHCRGTEGAGTVGPGRVVLTVPLCYHRRGGEVPAPQRHGAPGVTFGGRSRFAESPGLPQTFVAYCPASQESVLVINRPASRVEMPASPKVSAGAPDTLADRVRSLRLPSDREYEATPWRRWVALALIGLLAAGGGAAFLLLPDGDAKLTANQTDNAAESPSSQSPESTDRAGNHPTTTPSTATAPSSTTRRTTTPGVAAAQGPIAAAGEVVLESKGYIIPAHQILVSPKVSGMIVELHLEEGRRVHKGDVLAVLETTDYDADFARAEAMLAMAKHKLSELEHGNRPEEIAAAQAELAEAQAQREQLQSAWRRNQPLKGTKVLSDTDYEQSESQFKAMDRRVARLNSNYKLMVAGPRQERIELARAEVRQAEAELAKVQWRLDNCTIRAPISGTILKKNAEEGNIVNPVAFNGSYSVCDLADLADLEVDLSIQERDIARVHVGQRCLVRPEAFTDRVYEGVVSRLMPIADRAKGAVPVRVKLRVPADEEGAYLKPEMSAVVSFLNSTEETPPQ